MRGKGRRKGKRVGENEGMKGAGEDLPHVSHVAALHMVLSVLWEGGRGGLGSGRKVASGREIIGWNWEVEEIFSMWICV